MAAAASVQMCGCRPRRRPSPQIAASGAHGLCKVALVALAVRPGRRRVIDARLGYSRTLTAGRAAWVAPGLDLGECSGLRVESEQPADEGLAVSSDELQGLIGLKASYDSREHAQDTSFASGRGELRRRRLRIKTPVAGALKGDKG